MRIALFHNPKAGSSRSAHSKFLRSFEKAELDLLYRSVKKPNWDQELEGKVDCAIIAGGDGTVSRLAPWLNQRGIPFGILPLGTANNIAKNLGRMHTVKTVLAALRAGQTRKIDLGILKTSGGEKVFIEAVGFGLLGSAMSKMRRLERKGKVKVSASSEKKMKMARNQLRHLSEDFEASPYELLVDGEEVSGSFVLLELANMAIIGPNLQLIPNIDPGDGFLDLVWLDASERKAWKKYLGLIRKGEPVKAPFASRRCKEVKFHHVPTLGHLDGKPLPAGETPISGTVRAGALEMFSDSLR